VVAIVLKYGDNVLKNFSTACSVVLGVAASSALFGFVPGRFFLWGAGLVVSSRCLVPLQQSGLTLNP